MDRTIQNLTKAFIGESQARNRYSMYASVARKEGYEQIGEIFIMTADNEREHASVLFKLINELKKDSNGKYDTIQIEAEAPTIYGRTVDNLKAAIDGENYEHTKMYPEFAAVAEQEGLVKIAGRLKSIAKAEEHHEERYLKILKQLEAGTFFKKPQSVWWFCRECGYIHYGPEPPEVCPACEHPRSFYQLLNEQF